MADLIIGGAGLFGLTIAEQAASAGFSVKIIELQDKIGGNVASHIDEQTNVEVHTYGSHIFHTDNENVWAYVNQFTDFVPYAHRVRTTIANGSVIPLPFTLASYSAYFNKAFTPDLMRKLVATFPYGTHNFEDVAIASIGEDLYNAVVKGYTQKQWGRNPKDLPAMVIKRLPIRYNWNDGYFTDKYQGLPTCGYQTWMERMIDNPLISVELSQDIMKAKIDAPLVYTGQLDAYFGYKFGRLGWRSVDLVTEYPTTNDYQGCAVMNYGDADIPYTRIHEYKHYRLDKVSRGTIIHKEYARDTQPDEVGAYPVNADQDRVMLEQYRKAASELNGVWLGGRLGSYKYIDMHAAIASALTMWNNEIKPYLEAQ